MAKENVPANALSNGARKRQIDSDLVLLEKSVTTVAKMYPKKKVALTLKPMARKVDSMRRHLKKLEKKDPKVIAEIEKDLYSLAYRMHAIFPDPSVGGESALKPKNGAKELSRKELKRISSAHKDLSDLVVRYEPAGLSAHQSPLDQTPGIKR